MSLKDKVKKIITDELANFLVSNNTAPECIDIQITYPESRANLRIESAAIAETLKNKIRRRLRKRARARLRMLCTKRVRSSRLGTRSERSRL